MCFLPKDIKTVGAEKMIDTSAENTRNDAYLIKRKDNTWFQIVSYRKNLIDCLKENAKIYGQIENLHLEKNKDFKIFLNLIEKEYSVYQLTQL